MSIITLSALTARKRQLNQLCTAAVEQQVGQNKAENTQLRQRRRYLAKQVLKRVSLGQHRSNHHWLHAVTMVFALWGFNDLLMPNQAVAAPSFSTENPFANKGVASSSAPVFEDIDGDGDLDLFIGKSGFGIKYYRNTEFDVDVPGTGFVNDNAGNPLALVNEDLSKVAFADIDQDGDLDAFVGQYYNDIKYFRNTEIDADVPGTGFVADAAGNPLALVPYVYGGYNNSSITFADIDGDGDLDAFVGQTEGVGSIKYYRNTRIDADVPGTGFVADAAGNPLALVSGGFPELAFADIDDDGDLDAFAGQWQGNTKYYRNTEIDADVPGTGFVADAVNNPLAGHDPGTNAAPAFADLDNDGDLDAFIGASNGRISYYRNTQFDADTPGIGLIAENPLSVVQVALLTNPRFADVDGDGDLDAFVGSYGGAISYYRNTEIDLDAPGTGFIADAGANPFTGLDFGNSASIDLADIDQDGDLDLFAGALNGTIKYYRNTEIDAGADVGFIADGAGNPLGFVDMGGGSAPTFADIDGDGDLDAFIGDGSTYTVKYYRNTRIDAGADVGFVADAAGNPFAGVVIGDASIIIHFADLDGDGDLDAFVGDRSGAITYFRNTEIDASVPGTGFVLDAAANPLDFVSISGFSDPNFADIDGDGDLDAFIGSERIKYYKNSDPVPVTVDDSLNAIAGIPEITVDVTANDLFKMEAPAGTFTISAFDATTANGATVTNNGGNTFSYTALADFAGSDSFTYTLDDGNGNTAVGTVLVSVDGSGGGGDGGGTLNPWSLLLLPVLTLLRRKK